MPSEVMEDVSESGFRIGDTRFRVHRPGDARLVTTPDEVIVLKGPGFLRKYDALFSSLPSPDVVEMGIFEGGSAIYFGLAFPELRFTAIDLKEESPSVIAHLERLGLQERVSLHYRVDQADKNRVLSIVRDRTAGGLLGMVIDDASHFYEASKATFEALFPCLSVGGLYCLEDWAWAHEPGRCQADVWMDEPALSNLLFEIILLEASHGGSISSVLVEREVATIKRGSRPFSSQSIADMLLLRGKCLQLI